MAVTEGGTTNASRLGRASRAPTVPGFFKGSLMEGDSASKKASSRICCGGNSTTTHASRLFTARTSCLPATPVRSTRL